VQVQNGQAKQRKKVSGLVLVEKPHFVIGEDDIIDIIDETDITD